MRGKGNWQTESTVQSRGQRVVAEQKKAYLNSYTIIPALQTTHKHGHSLLAESALLCAIVGPGRRRENGEASKSPKVTVGLRREQSAADRKERDKLSRRDGAQEELGKERVEGKDDGWVEADAMPDAKSVPARQWREDSSDYSPSREESKEVR